MLPFFVCTRMFHWLGTNITEGTK